MKKNKLFPIKNNDNFEEIFSGYKIDSFTNDDFEVTLGMHNANTDDIYFMDDISYINDWDDENLPTSENMGYIYNEELGIYVIRK